MKFSFSKTYLRNQLVITVATLVITATIIFGYFQSRQQEELIISEFENATTVLIEAVKLGLEIGLKEENFESINEVLSWGIENPNIAFIALTEENGTVLASYPVDLELDINELQAFPSEVSLSNDVFVKQKDWYSSLSGNSKIYMGFKNDYLVELQRKAIINLIVIILLVTLGSIISIYLIAGNITKPLERLKSVTLKIADNKLENRADEFSGSQEIRLVAASFNSMIDKLLDSQKQRIDQMESFNQSLEERNNKLSEAYEILEKQKDQIEKAKARTEKTLEELKETQLQLIQSEKMASLGNLIAGIAHEINTPAGAINSAIAEVEKDHVVLLNHLLDLVKQLPDEIGRQFLEITQKILSFDKNLSTKEQRAISKKMQVELENLHVENARFLSKNLAQIGFNTSHIHDYKEIFTNDKLDEFVHVFHLMGMSQIHVRDIQIAIGRIAQLIRALKSYSHLDNNSLTYTDLAEDLDNTLIILHNKTKRAITVKKEFQEVPKFFGFADNLNQVWTNLIHNSIQAMKGDGVLTIRLFQREDNQIQVDVEDNGPGIPNEIINKIFDPYFTTKNKGEGTGLGLSISNDIVKKHNGYFEVRTNSEKTCFSVILPVRTKEEINNERTIDREKSENNV